ncbi:hypothetical protein ACLB2K_066377 [Fragaria x ananassa]
MTHAELLMSNIFTKVALAVHNKRELPFPKSSSFQLFTRSVYQNMKKTASSISLLVLVLIFAIVMADACAPSPSSAPPPEPLAYIVYTLKPENEEPKAYHIRILTAVLGSEEAAEKALVYSYKIIPGFSAKLTPEQVTEIQKQPGVLQVQPNRTYKLLDSGPQILTRINLKLH